MKLKDSMDQKWTEFLEQKGKEEYVDAIIEALEDVCYALDADKSCEEAHDRMYEHNLTGFMAGMVSKCVVEFHVRGEEYREFWNARYGVKNSDIVVNPAIIEVNI